MVSLRGGWSSQDTRSVTSLSPRSKSDALDALRDLAGLTLKEPLEVVTACRNNWYWAAETFLALSESKAAEKFTGEASLGGDSDDDNLLMGERERVASLVSSITLALLTGVLDRLTGVLGRRSGVLGGVLDILGGVSSSLGVGTDDCAAGLAWA